MSSGWLSTRPPTRLRASSTITERPALTISRAAVSPARPAPTTITLAERTAARPEFGSATTAAPAAAPPIRPRRVIPLVCIALPSFVPQVHRTGPAGALPSIAISRYARVAERRRPPALAQLRADG